MLGTWSLAKKAEKWLLIDICTFFLPGFVCTVSVGATAIAILVHPTMRKKLRYFPYGAWLLAWAVLTLAEEFIFHNKWGLLFSCYLFPLILLTIFYQQTINPRLFLPILRLLQILGLLSVVVAIVERCWKAGRVSSVFYNPNYYGYVCELLLLLGVYAGLKDEKYRGLHGLGVVASIAGIFLAGSYFSLLAALCGILLLLFCLPKMRSAWTLLGGMIAYGVAGFFFPVIVPKTKDLVQNIGYRQHIWQATTYFLQGHWWIGRGLLSFYFLSTGMDRSFRAHTHNLFLDVLLNFGILGAVPLAIFVCLWGIRLFHNCHHQTTCALFLGVLFSTLVHGMIDIPIVGFHTTALFALCFLMVRAPRNIQPKTKRGLNPNNQNIV